MTTPTPRKKIIETAFKLREHATRGVEHEKITAQEMFTKYCAKHKITSTELAGAKKVSYDFTNPTNVVDFFNKVCTELKLTKPQQVKLAAAAVGAFFIGRAMFNIFDTPKPKP